MANLPAQTRTIRSCFARGLSKIRASTGSRAASTKRVRESLDSPKNHRRAGPWRKPRSGRPRRIRQTVCPFPGRGAIAARCASSCRCNAAQIRCSTVPGPTSRMRQADVRAVHVPALANGAQEPSICAEFPRIHSQIGGNTTRETERATRIRIPLLNTADWRPPSAQIPHRIGALRARCRPRRPRRNAQLCRSKLY